MKYDLIICPFYLKKAQLFLTNPRNLTGPIWAQDKSAYSKIDFRISQPKHMLWVLKRIVSMRRFFWAPKTYVKNYVLKKNS